MLIRKLSFLIVSLGCLVSANAQDNSTPATPDSLQPTTGIDVINTDPRLRNLSLAGDEGFINPSKNLSGLKKISITGYYRQIVYDRYLSWQYVKTMQGGRTFFIGDYAYNYNEPPLQIFISGSPTQGTTFVADLQFGTTYDGNTGSLRPQMMMNFFTTIKTKFSTFGVRFGGLHWYEISDLTLGSVSKTDRYSIFERTPWEAHQAVNVKYDDYYNRGAVNRDERWGKREFNGIIVESADLPLGLDAKFMYGRTGQNGNWQSVLPNYIIAGKINKKLGTTDHIGINTVNKISTTDSTSMKAERVSSGVYTVDVYKTFNDIIVKAEFGTGYYQNNFKDTPESYINYGKLNYPMAWSEAVNLKIFLPKRITFVPLELLAFRVGKNFINANSSVGNSSNFGALRNFNEALNQGNSVTVNTPFASPIIDNGDLTNNRQGVGFNTEFKLANVKINLGLAWAQQIEVISSEYLSPNGALSNQISYSHRVFSYPLNHIYGGWDYYKGTAFGPYQRMRCYFRGVYEIVDINEPNYKKSFNTADLQIKYKGKVLNTNVWLFNKSTLQSAQKNMLIVPAWDTAQTVLTCLYNETDLYVQVHPKVTLCGYMGYENIRANSKTNKDLNTKDITGVTDAVIQAYMPSGKPRHQIGIGYGLGCDIELGKKMGLYLRHRWINFQDKNFALDKVKGHETTAELKIFF